MTEDKGPAPAAREPGEWDLVPDDLKRDLAGESPPTSEELGTESPVEPDEQGFDPTDLATADTRPPEGDRPGPTTARPASHGSMLLVLCAVAGVYALIVVCQLILYRGNPTSFLQVGDRRVGPIVATIDEARNLPESGSTHYSLASFTSRTIVYTDDEGYDGALYFLVAIDPFMRRGENDAFDLNIFRGTGKSLSNYRRVGYTGLVYALSTGSKTCIPWAMIAVNLLSVIAATWATAALLRRHRIDIYLAATVGLSAGMLFGFYYMTPVPMAVALVAVMALAYDRGLDVVAAMAAAGAALAWEMSLVVTVPIALHSLLSGRYSRAVLLGLSAVPLVAAHFYFAHALQRPFWFGEASMIGPPLWGLAKGLRAIFHVGRGEGLMALVRGSAVVPAMLFVLIVCIMGLVKFLRGGGAWTLALFFAAFVTLSGYQDWWATFANAARVNALLFLLVLLAYVEHRGRATRHPLALGIMLTLLALAKIAIDAYKPFTLAGGIG